MTVAMIDADVLVYEAAYRAQDTYEWTPGEFTEHANIRDAKADFKGSVDGIVVNTGADSAILTLSEDDRDANFRRRCWPEYKNKRGKAHQKRPLLFNALREWITDEFNPKIKHGIEADDTLGIMATGDIKGLPPISERIVCSVDKDLLTIPGQHFNWRKPEDGVFPITEDVAFGYFMCQTLMGDSTDGYPGCESIGPVKALKILGDLDPKDMWNAVKLTFASKGHDEKYALNQARCARILRAKDWDFENEQPLLWVPARDEWK